MQDNRGLEGGDKFATAEARSFGGEVAYAAPEHVH